MQFATE